jgi:hypothetical protein
MVAAGAEVIDLSSPGWTPSKDNIEKATTVINSLVLGEKDALFLDLFSNCAYLGTDEMGFPKPAVRSAQDGFYHILGELQAAPKTVLQKIMTDSEPLLTAAGKATSVLVAPLPRYVSGKCCNDDSHITNFAEVQYMCELKKPAEVFAALMSNGNHKVFTLSDLVPDNADLLYEATGVIGGGGVWASGDPVHLSKAAYQEIAKALVNMAEDASGTTPAKRIRLNSIVLPQGGTRRPAKTVALPAWIMGRSERQRGRGSGYGKGPAWRNPYFGDAASRGGGGPYPRAYRGQYGRRRFGAGGGRRAAGYYN